MDLTQANRVLTDIGERPSTADVATSIGIVLGMDALPEGVVWRILHTYANRSVIGSQLSGFGTGKVLPTAPGAWYATVGCVLRDCPGKRTVDRRDPPKSARISAVEQALWRKTTAEQLQAETIPRLERQAGQGCAEARAELDQVRVQLARVLHGSVEEIREPGRTIRTTMMDSLGELQACPEYQAGMRYLCKAFWRCAHKDRSFLRYVYLDADGT